MRTHTLVSASLAAITACSVEESSLQRPLAASATHVVRAGTIGVLQVEGETPIFSGPLTEYTADFSFITKSCASERRIGSCYVFDCDPASYAGVSAGDVRFARPGQSAVTLSPDADAVYPVVDLLEASYQPLVPVAVTATGGDLPAFKRTVTFPQRVTFSAPVLGTTAPVVIDPNQALQVAWSLAGPPRHTSATVSLRALDTDREIFAECFFDASRLSASIPRAVLAPFAGHEQVFVALAGQSRLVRTTAGFAIDTRAVLLDTANVVSVAAADVTR